MSEAASYDHLVPEVILKLNNKIRQVPSLTSEVLSGTWLDQGEKDLVAGDHPPLPPHHRDPQLPRRAQGAEGVRSSCQRLHEDLQWGTDQQRLACLNSLRTTLFSGSLFWKKEIDPGEHLGGGGDVESDKATPLSGCSQHGARLQGHAAEVPAGDGGGGANQAVKLDGQQSAVKLDDQ